MTFLAIIIAVLVLQAWGTAERVHYDDWFDNWRLRVESWGLGAGISLVLVVLVPVFVMQLLLGAVQPILFGLLWLLLAIALLLYAFGRGDFQASMGRYRGYAYSGDFEAAYLAASEEFSWGDGENAPDSAVEVHDRIQRALLYEGFQRWFAVMFYFLLFGPAGALGYRLSQLYTDGANPGSAQRWLVWLDWVPARLLASTFALTGDFIGCREKLLAGLRDTAQSASDLLYSVGAAALGMDVSSPRVDDAAFGPDAAAQNREIDALLSRAAVCWIVVLALLVLLF